MRLLVAPALLLLLTGCSSSEFNVSNPGDDAGALDDTASSVDAASGDTGTAVDDTAVADAPVEDVPAPSDAPCSPLGASPSTIYVDARASGPSIGTAACPSKTIAGALAIAAGLGPGARTIRVAGSTPALLYNETSALVLKHSFALVGDGVSKVTITGGGACSTATCVVVLEGGASIEGVTISAGSAMGIASAPAIGTRATVKGVTVSGGIGGANAAIYVNGKGSIDLGPELRVKGNAGPGVVIDDTALAKLAGDFSENAAGIVVKGGLLQLDGGTALANKTNGVALLSAAKHSIANFTARDNLAAGVFVEANASLTMRGSTLVKNRYGLVFRFGTGNALDLGTLADYGKNVFGGPSGINSKAAVCLPLARTAKQPAVGNKWFVCEPTRLLLGTGGCEGISAYQDVYYAAVDISTPAPLDGSACDVGP